MFAFTITSLLLLLLRNKFLSKQIKELFLFPLKYYFNLYNDNFKNKKKVSDLLSL